MAISNITLAVIFLGIALLVALILSAFYPNSLFGQIAAAALGGLLLLINPSKVLGNDTTGA